MARFQHDDVIKILVVSRREIKELKQEIEELHAETGGSPRITPRVAPRTSKTPEMKRKARC